MHKIVARARFPKNIVAKKNSEHFWKMGPTKSAQDCNGSSVSHTNRKKLSVWNPFGRWGQQNADETAAKVRFHTKIVKNAVFRSLLEDGVGKRRTRL